MSKGWHQAGDGGAKRWRKVRAAVLERNERENGGRCQIAIEGKCTGLATCVDHMLGRRMTGDDPRYLRASCRQCNEHLGDPTRKPDPPARPVTVW